MLAKSMPIRVPGMYARPKSVQHADSDSSDDETPDLKDMQVLHYTTVCIYSIGSR